MTAAHGADLDAILATVREVEQTIERRAARAMGAVMVAWGLAASSIFAFYGWVHASPGNPLLEGLRDTALIHWAWAVPAALAYAATLATGARLGRIGAPRNLRKVRWLLLALLPPFAVVVFASVTHRGNEYLPGMWVLFLGAAGAMWCRDQEGVLGRLLLGAAVASGVVGAALVAQPGAWAYWAAAAWYLVALAGLGAAKYHLAR